MPQHKLRAVFMRGGTSNALMFRREDLPAAQADWAPIFLAAMGSPDPNGRQLDGMGGGVSSVSKVCVIGPPSRADADVDYTFGQVMITTAMVDYAANCGNMSSAIGPFAVDEGLVPRPAGPEALVRIHNTNTGKIIHARFPVEDGMAAIDGDLVLDGVAGTAAPIRLEFLNPAGAGTGKLLPTGHAIDHLKVDGLGEVEVSLIDATNACMFVAAASMGITGLELPVEMERNTELLVRLDAMRCLASVAMGLTSSIEEARRMPTAPKVAMVAPAAAARTLGGKTLEAGDMDIHVRMISSGQPHRATELTGAMCLAAACRVPGSVPHRMLLEAAHTGPVRIGHPSGVVLVDSAAEMQGDAIHIRHATVYRTARRLFQGEVFYRVPTALALAAE